LACRWVLIIRTRTHLNFNEIFKRSGRLKGFSVMGDCGRQSASGTLLKRTTNLHAQSQHFSSYSFRDLSVNTDMARSTQLLILIKNIYMYFMGSETLYPTCYILSDESSNLICILIIFDPISNFTPTNFEAKTNYRFVKVNKCTVVAVAK